MLQITIELLSAITGNRSEIGRMYIANDGTGTADLGDYKVAVCRRGETAVPSPVHPRGPKPTRSGEVKGYPRLKHNVWRLIARALTSAFPEEAAPARRRTGDQPVLDAQVMRGLHTIRAVASVDVLLARESDDVAAACAWLDAAHKED